MTKFKTNNPLGSTDPSDLYDNAQNFDTAINSITTAIWLDRFGGTRQTWFGIEGLARAAIAAFGYIKMGTFQLGATLTLPNQILRDTTTGEDYRWDGAFPPNGKLVPANSTPMTTGGIGRGAWLGIGDGTLRGELAKPGGVNLVEGAATAADLLAHESSSNPHPQMTAFITAEANRAETAANAASITANVFESTAAGITGTSAGQYFSVVSATNTSYLDLYRNVSGVATYQKSYPSTALVNQLQQASNKLTGGSGFAMDGSDGMSTIEVAKGERKALVIGTGTTEMMVVDTVANAVSIPESSLKFAKVTSRLTAGESTEDESENTEDLVRSEKAKVIGDALHSLTFDTVNGELITTFKIVDNSQNPGTSFSDEIPSMITGIPAGYEESNRKFQGVPSIARSGSRYWMAWWADKNSIGENHGNFFVIGYSDDNCKTFTQSHILAYPANNNHKLLDPMLWTNPESGEMWLFFGSMSKPEQSEDGLIGCWCTVLENPNAPRGFSWSLPVKYRNIGDPRRPVRIGGKWLQCIDMYRATIQPIYPETAGCEFVEFNPLTKSTVNLGHNTPNNNGAYGGYFETELIQRMDGSLMSTTRGASSTAGILWRSFSYDGGKTWSAQEAYSALGTVGSSRTWLGRLPSGRLLIVYNASTNRKALTIKLSEDDGETWPYSVVLEGADSPQTVSYPIVAFDGDDIYTIYDYGRDVANEIRVTTVKETEIVAGTAVPDINIISSAHVTP
ncbi:exo-alpha-sialidase [Leclercia adecarboxylata]|nr:exo-alpha-sialidase [Leclercia adecarboxylata]MBK0350826.1 exo-alpha-sialidase [Leclercia adecarboxylata]